ncbi:hypothetical protein EV363DRAFT_270195 [Boletus edulis]|nr:hypothetical protein EV363DRAFT_270195 [Boletus edulis]
MPLENRVDVLIVGAGPSGVMQATALAMAGVDVKIIDKRLNWPCGWHSAEDDGKFSGYAVPSVNHCRLKRLQYYGLAERLIREGAQVHKYGRFIALAKTEVSRYELCRNFQCASSF